VARRWCGALPGNPAASWVLAGDAAHNVHPLAGQGLNLGLGDVQALARILQERDAWRSTGDSKLLRRYERERKAGLAPMGLAMDGLQQLFSRPEAPLQALRNWGMQAFERSGPLKTGWPARPWACDPGGCLPALTGEPLPPRPPQPFVFASYCTVVFMKLIPSALLVAAALTLGLSAHAQDANLKKTLAERIPQLDKIDEIRPTPMQGLYEVRIGTDLFYTDAKGNYLIQGELIDTKARRNLTEDRITKLTAVDFKDLPLRTPSPSCGQGRAQAGRVRRPELRLLQALSSATCRRWTTSPSTCSSTPS
jgi:hypothetical protein